MARHFGQCPAHAPLQHLMLGTCHFRARVSIRIAALGRVHAKRSLPGKHLFQASRILPNRMRPVIFHAFWESQRMLPRFLMSWQLGWGSFADCAVGALLHVDTWKPIEGCFFTGSPTALAGNSAFRFCLLMQSPHKQQISIHPWGTAPCRTQM